MRYDPDKHKRRSIRLKNYDYSQAGLYFITLCCQNRIHLFGSIASGKMHLNEFGEIVRQEWLKTASIRDNIDLHDFIIMPNHFHGILEILFSKGKKPEKTGNTFQSPSQTIGAIIRGFKGASTRRIKELIYSANSGTGELQFAPIRFAPDTGELRFAQKGSAPATGELRFAPLDLSKSIWQRNYYENIIRNEQAYQRISAYILNNPSKWQHDKFHGS